MLMMFYYSLCYTDIVDFACTPVSLRERGVVRLPIFTI